MINSDAVYHGINFDKESDKFVRCARCGFPCKIERDIRAPEGSRVGWGITNKAFDVCEVTYDQVDQNYQDGAAGYTEPNTEYDKNSYSYDTGLDDSSQINYDGIAKTIYDPVQTGGCSQCGTLLYNK